MKCTHIYKYVYHLSSFLKYAKHSSHIPFSLVFVPSPWHGAGVMEEHCAFVFFHF